MDVAALRLFVLALAAWRADQRDETVAYLVEESRILRAHLRGRISLQVRTALLYTTALAPDPTAAQAVID